MVVIWSLGDYNGYFLLSMERVGGSWGLLLHQALFWRQTANWKKKNACTMLLWKICEDAAKPMLRAPCLLVLRQTNGVARMPGTAMEPGSSSGHDFWVAHCGYSNFGPDSTAEGASWTARVLPSSRTRLLPRPPASPLKYSSLFSLLTCGATRPWREDEGYMCEVPGWAILNDPY